MQAISQRILKHAEPEPNSGCWLWTGAVDKDGYGRVQFGGASRPAHRVAYVAFVGLIPPGQQLDHLCEVKCCVNPRHLLPATPRENVMRSDTPARRNSLKMHCPRGHPYDTVWKHYGRAYRACNACRRKGG